MKTTLDRERTSPQIRGRRGACAICKMRVHQARILCEKCALPRSFKPVKLDAFHPLMPEPSRLTKLFRKVMT